MPETRKRHVPSSSGSTSPTHNSVSSSGPNKDEASRSFSHTLGLLIIFISLSCVTTLYLLPSPIEPIEYSLPLPPEFIGPLAENKLLAKADKLFLDRLRGPESITVHNGKLFTGTADGKILEINGDDIRVVATLGKPPCGKFDDEPTCGRPLGMRFDKDGSLVVVDAYLGLFRVNVETGKFVQLYSPETLVDGEQAAFLNDLDIDSDGTVYFTDSSTNWGRRYNRYAAMEAKKNGRLLAYNPNTKQTEVILKNMSFPNGVQLSPEKDFILIAELCTCKILQYHTKGPRKGEVEIFSDNLPGAPDNIRPSSSGGYWVGLATTRRAGKFSLLDYTSTKPWMKKLIFKVFSQEFLLKMIPKYGLVIELDASGNIIRSLHDPSGEDVPNVSEMCNILKGILNKEYSFDILLDRWPNFEVVVASPEDSAKQVEDHVSSVYFIYHKPGSEDAATKFLHKGGVIDWKFPPYFRAAPSSLYGPLTGLAQQHGYKVELIARTYIYVLEKEDLVILPPPEGMRLGHLTMEHIDAMENEWKFNSYLPKQSKFLSVAIQDYLSAALFTSTGQCVAYVCTYCYGPVGALYVLPECRGKGHGKCVLSQLAQEHLKNGRTPYCYIETDNVVSQQLHEKLGFRRLPNYEACFMQCSHPEKVDS